MWNGRVGTLDIQTTVQVREDILVQLLQLLINLAVQASILIALHLPGSLMARDLHILHQHSPILKDIRPLTLRDLHHPIHMIHKIHLMACQKSNSMVRLVNSTTVVLSISLHLKMHHNHNITKSQDPHLINLVQVPQVDMARLNINSIKGNINNINMVAHLAQKCQEEVTVVEHLQCNMAAILHRVINTNLSISNTVRKVDPATTLLLLLVATLPNQVGRG